MSADQMLDGITLVSIRSGPFNRLQDQSTQTPPPKKRKFNLLPIFNENQKKQEYFYRRKSHSPNTKINLRSQTPTLPNLTPSYKNIISKSRMAFPRLKRSSKPIRLEPWLESAKLLSRMPR
ncbi:unnamed protein product [Blepharisma stoltei]|uniref:Uncharacterized protein n=1 Tax=Blepharisma stoltei TaxID=1481888 RepID=A0AAU9J195_9CILI|nr:unnamed protein product [Blepharisma stoltei]